MCGLFGVIGLISRKEMAVLETLALVSVVRGEHSTGIFTVNKKDEISLYKKPVPVYDFMNLAETKEMLSNPLSLKAIVGHARHATVGEKTESNAHPFEFNNIVGAHNGTIDRECIKQFLDKENKFGTDSEAIFNKIDQSSIQEVIPELEGAWAITAWDKVENQLMVIRNRERELHCAYSLDKRTLFWASEESALSFALKNANYPYTIDSKSKSKSNQPLIMYFDENSLYRISGDAKLYLDKDKLVSTKVYRSKYTPPAISYYGGKSSLPDKGITSFGTNPYPTTHEGSVSKGSVSHQNLGNTTSLSNTKEYISTLIAPIVHQKTGEVLYKAADHTLFDEAMFKKSYDQECQLCEEPIEFNVGMAIFRDEPFRPICHKCVEKEPELLKLGELV
jgi:predicted glutamine amidotransferase